MSNSYFQIATISGDGIGKEIVESFEKGLNLFTSDLKESIKKYIREKFSDDENRKINEIFNFYDDGDDTLH